jgi:hypothetical protein
MIVGNLDNVPGKPPMTLTNKSIKQVAGRLEMEMLYEDNLALKSRINESAQENLRLKTLV